MSAIRSCLYHGLVTHRRLQPFRHELAYRVYAMLLDLAEAPRLDAGSLWFGYNRRALLSFNESDHGPRTGSPLLPWLRAELAKASLAEAGHRVALLCFPRILGYVFNPISVYFCYDHADRLGAILYEVKNTFGEQHCYLFPADPAARTQTHGCAKEFYVSPFIEMTADYVFTVAPPAERFNLFIRQTVVTGELLQANWNGTRLPWSDAALRHCFWRFPLLTLKIIWGIHWQALKIWAKKAKYYPRSPLPDKDVSIIDAPGK